MALICVRVVDEASVESVVGVTVTAGEWMVDERESTGARTVVVVVVGAMIAVGVVALEGCYDEDF